MICTICEQPVDNLVRHQPLLCQREAERLRVKRNERCPTCNGLTIHERNCSLWESFRKAGIT